MADRKLGLDHGVENTYVIRPNYQKKFRPALVKETIRAVLNEKLNGLQYHPEHTSQWTREISDEIKTRLKDLQLERYKFVVQVVIGEQRGEGVRMACRCFWDPDTDNYAQEVYTNETLFCVAAAFGVYLY
eukprot:TRINITY_DN2645_c0_g1_i5.p1 TRINITY_DN2645_c0_g1~~TRINITY_DN2645_c0_g1_i5.p1  ORF type:complete len:130 (-),score=26.32 TRINITY_DN2645_c0_g1_i5:153-542(-)